MVPLGHMDLTLGMQRHSRKDLEKYASDARTLGHMDLTFMHGTPL